MTRNLGAIALVVALGCGKKGAVSSAPADAAAALQRIERQSAGAQIAAPPVALDGGGLAAIVGPGGLDAEGFPLRHVDRAALRGMLTRKQYAALEEVFTRAQDDFEADPKAEALPIDASNAFESPEAELGAALDGWVNASPGKFAPLLARGAHYTSRAYAARGKKWAKDTPSDDFKAMKEPLARARVDLGDALALRPKLVAAQRLRILAAEGSGETAAEKDAITSALAACPTCFLVRVTYMFARTPRWGGSYEEMLRFAGDAEKTGAPRMKLLAGLVDYDKAQMLALDKRYDDALAAIGRACALGELATFLSERAQINLFKGDAAKARPDVEHALALRPGDPDLLIQRADVGQMEKRWEDAGRDLRDAMRVRAADARAKALLSPIVEWLLHDGAEAQKAGRREDAIRMFDLAAELSPNDARVQQWRAWTLAGDAGPDDAEAAVKRDPDDFEARRAFDYALAKQRQFDRIIASWTEYIARHPSDGRAYLERGGAYFNLRKIDLARADAVKACDLGVSEACARAKALGP